MLYSDARAIYRAENVNTMISSKFSPFISRIGTSANISFHLLN